MMQDDKIDHVLDALRNGRGISKITIAFTGGNSVAVAFKNLGVSAAQASVALEEFITSLKAKKADELESQVADQQEEESQGQQGE